jgi:hypothetical protein
MTPAERVGMCDGTGGRKGREQVARAVLSLISLAMTRVVSTK